MIKSYSLDLRNISTERFRTNPVVLYNWNYSSPDAIVGRVTEIAGDAVEIHFIDGIPKYDHFIAKSIWVNPETLEKELLAIAVLPKALDKPKVI